MSRKKSWLSRWVCLGAAVLLLSGCASAFMKGGALVDRGYQPNKVLVTYRAEGTVPQDVVYQLVETEWGPGIYEKSPDGSGAIFLLHWQDGQGDHFGGWVATSSGYEFVVPLDRTRNAKKYFYVAGTFRYEKTGDKTGKLVPESPVDPVATLIPIGE